MYIYTYLCNRMKNTITQIHCKYTYKHNYVFYIAAKYRDHYHDQGFGSGLILIGTGFKLRGLKPDQDPENFENRIQRNLKTGSGSRQKHRIRPDPQPCLWLLRSVCWSVGLSVIISEKGEKSHFHAPIVPHLFKCKEVLGRLFCDIACYVWAYNIYHNHIICIIYVLMDKIVKK